MSNVSKLIPPHPSSVSVIRAVTPNITTVSAPFKRFGLINVGGRSTIVRLTNGSLAVFSPTALTPEVRETVENLGNNVKYITAPDIEHHIFVSEWAKAFPNANVMGPEGLPEKRQKSGEDTKFTHVWTEKNKRDFKVDEAFDKDFDYEFVHSHGNKELVFNYRPDKTLIQADLIFNLPAYEQYSKSDENPTGGFATRFFGGIMNTRGNATWQRRFLWYGVSQDKKTFNESIRRIDGWNFDKMIPCHGDVIESGAKGVFQNVMAWHLASQKKQ
jgi:hypothetical protein